MGGDSFGDFQANVGRASASMGVIGSDIFLGLAVVACVVCVWLALVPSSWGESTNAECGKGPFPTCTMPGEVCEDGRCKVPKTRHLWLAGVGAAVLLLAVLSRWWSKWWNTQVQKNKGLAQLGGLGAEANMVEDALGGNNNANNMGIGGIGMM